MTARLVCLGAFAGAHGVRGDAKIRTFTEVEENIAAYGPLCTEDGRIFNVKVLSVLKPGLVLARVKEIATREQVEALGGVKLFVARNTLPPAEDGSFYIEDLIGLAAVDEDGAALGRIAAMHNFGAGDIIELQPEHGSTIFVPFTGEAASGVDIAARRITLRRALTEPPPPDEDEPG